MPLSFTNSNSLIDIYRAKFPNTPMYTWVNGPRTIGCRLDWFYVPLSWKNLVSNVTAKPFVYSDHSLIRMACTVGHSRSRGPGIWKFNTSLLKSDKFCEETNTFGSIGVHGNHLSQTRGSGGMLENCLSKR